MNARSERTRRELVQAFWQLYQSKPIEEITIKEISSNAGHYRTTFYKYFDSIDSILKLVQEMLMPTISDEFRSVDLDDLAAHAVDNYVDITESFVDISKLNSDDDFYVLHYDAMKRAFKKYAPEPICIEGVEYDLVYEFLYAGFSTCMNTWYANYQDQVPKERMKELMSDIFNHGLNKAFFKKQD